MRGRGSTRPARRVYQCVQRLIRPSRSPQTRAVGRFSRLGWLHFRPSEPGSGARMFRTRPVAITVVALAVSLPVAACGGGEDEESFKEDYNAAVKPLTELNSDIGDSLGGAGGQSNEAIAKEFDKL